MTDIAEVVEDVSAEAVVEGESSEPVSEPAPSTPSEPQLTPEQMRQMVTTAIEQRDTQWQAEIGRREQAAAQAAQETPQPDPTPAASSDDIDEQIAALYTDDKTGRETQRAITNHLNLMLQKLGISGGNSGLTVEDVQKIIEKLKNKNIGVLITDHNVRETLTITDRSYLLYNGKILKSGTTKELTEDEEAKKLYLGTKFKMDFS